MLVWLHSRTVIDCEAFGDYFRMRIVQIGLGVVQIYCLIGPVGVWYLNQINVHHILILTRNWSLLILPGTMQCFIFMALLYELFKIGNSNHIHLIRCFQIFV